MQCIYVFHLSEDTLIPPLFFQEQYNVIWVMNTSWWEYWLVFHFPLNALWFNCYNVTNKCRHFFRITIEFQYANSNMSWVLLAHHQGMQSCTKQSSNPTFPVCRIVPSSLMYEYRMDMCKVIGAACTFECVHSTAITLYTGNDTRVGRLFYITLDSLIMGQQGPKHVGVCVLQHYYTSNSLHIETLL
jgi:hypothetical protein